MLDKSQTNVLLASAQLNDKQAKEKLINENSPLIKSVIKRYVGKGIEYDDLYQLGSLGFLKAINNFDESFGVKFSTYAVPMIAGEIKRYLRDNGILKVSRSVKALNVQINKYIQEYLMKNGISPNINNIAEYFNITAADAVYAIESSKQIISLSTTVGDDDGKKQELIEKIEDENSIETRMNNELLYSIIRELNPRDKKIIILRYFRDKTQKEIAQELGVSQVQISRLETRILKEMKSKLQ